MKQELMTGAGIGHTEFSTFVSAGICPRQDVWPAVSEYRPLPQSSKL